MRIFLRKILLITAFIAFMTALSAQTARDEIRQDYRRSGSNLLAYPGPTQQQLTPAPQGMKPFYISHYGRHGSRYLTKPSFYNDPYRVLTTADSLGKLTPYGQDIMQRLDVIRQDAENRWGELTPLGAEQHQQIAARMAERFPEVFTDTTTLDARSTGLGRSILSMEYELLQLLRLFPRLKFHHNATHRDIVYLNYQDKNTIALKNNQEAQKLYEPYAKTLDNHQRLMSVLFNDTAYVNHHVNATELSSDLFVLTSGLQNTELREQLTLYDLWTEEEIYQHWLRNNANWYVGYGCAPVNGGIQPYTQSNLLHKLIHDADSCLQLVRPSIQLRFGHDTVILPLVCLLDINGYGLSTDQLETLEQRGWIDYRVFPMGANIQFIFYRRHPQDKDVLFKVLLNENEATLPLETDMPPYYKWSDFREYYLHKLEAFEK